MVTGIASRRLKAQRLIGEPSASPVDVVRWLGAVQSQDYAGAKWAVAQRTRGITEAQLDRLFDEGAILRTHVLRPTWHFVLPEDAGWLLRLTGPRVLAGLAGRYRELELDDRTVARALAEFARALAGSHHLTRQELGQVLHVAGISPEGQRLPHLIARAELGGLIISGPRRGKQFTYALLDERVPKSGVLDRDEAVTEIARRYFRSHGPAQMQDFVWWSGLTVSDARLGIAQAGAALEHQSIAGKDYWFDSDAGPPRNAAKAVHLLPNFDEYTVAYRDRAVLIHAERSFEPALFAFRSILSNVVTVGGVVRGAWRRAAARKGMRVEIRGLGQFEPTEVASVEKSGRMMSRFFENPVELVWL